MKYFFNVIEMKPEVSFQKFPDDISSEFLKGKGYFDTPEEATERGIAMLESQAAKLEAEAQEIRDKIAAFKAQQLPTGTYRKHTVGWWLQRLPEPYKSQAFENCNDDFCDIASEEAFNAPGAIGGAFYWGDTPVPQGGLYWRKICDSLASGEIALLPEPPEPDNTKTLNNNRMPTEGQAQPLEQTMVSGSLLPDLDYWKQRCLLAETCLKETPCDPDITPEQIKAWSAYNKFISWAGNDR